MKIQKREEGGFLVLSLLGEIEVYEAEALENEIDAAVKAGAKDMIIDMAGLNYISSSGLRVLITARGEIKKAGGALMLASIKEKVLEVFRISKLLAIFDVRKDVEDALKG